jgi:hypothetical protein
MKFEKFYLVDMRGKDGKVILKFVHTGTGHEIKASVVDLVKILQFAEIQIQTRFVTEKVVKKFAKHQYRNLRGIKEGDQINVFHIPVEYSDEEKVYFLANSEEKQPDAS